MNEVVEMLGNPTDDFKEPVIYCPGCKCGHVFHQRGPVKWNWNGDRVRPTFTPSMLVTWPGTPKRCHSYVTNGNIQFLADCSHELAGKTVALTPYQEEID